MVGGGEGKKEKGITSTMARIMMLATHSLSVLINLASLPSLLLHLFLNMAHKPPQPSMFVTNADVQSSPIFNLLPPSLLPSTIESLVQLLCGQCLKTWSMPELLNSSQQEYKYADPNPRTAHNHLPATHHN